MNRGSPYHHPSRVQPPFPRASPQITAVERNGGDSWGLLMDTVEIKGSNIPLLRQLLDGGLRLKTRDLGG